MRHVDRCAVKGQTSAEVLVTKDNPFVLRPIRACGLDAGGVPIQADKLYPIVRMLCRKGQDICAVSTSQIDPEARVRDRGEGQQPVTMGPDIGWTIGYRHGVECLTSFLNIPAQLARLTQALDVLRLSKTHYAPFSMHPTCLMSCATLAPGCPEP